MLTETHTSDSAALQLEVKRGKDTAHLPGRTLHEGQSKLRRGGLAVIKHDDGQFEHKKFHNYQGDEYKANTIAITDGKVRICHSYVNRDSTDFFSSGEALSHIREQAINCMAKGMTFIYTADANEHKERLKRMAQSIGGQVLETGYTRIKEVTTAANRR